MRVFFPPSLSPPFSLFSVHMSMKISWRYGSYASNEHLDKFGVFESLRTIEFSLKQLTSSRLVFPTPLAPKKAALSGPRYHCWSLPSIVIRYAEYRRFCICICSIAANDKAAALVPVNVLGDVRPATMLLAP